MRTQLVNSMAAVSPATLAMPKITLVTMPGAAAGMLVALIALHFVVPKAKAASLKEGGTIFSASSVPLITMGSIIKDKVNQPAAKDTPKPSCLLKKV
jgi:predicted RecA/RadA family phage recombinase